MMDLDFARDFDKRRSTTSYAFILTRGVINWVSKLQIVMTLSTKEIEYMAAQAYKKVV